MKSTGIVRKIDELGRLVIPMEIRRGFNLDVKDPVEFFIEEDRIILKKYQPGCRGCNKTNDLIEVYGIKLCNDCFEKVHKKSAKIKKEFLNV